LEQPYTWNHKGCYAAAPHPTATNKLGKTWGRGLGTSAWDLQACRASVATYLYVSAPH